MVIELHRGVLRLRLKCHECKRFRDRIWYRCTVCRSPDTGIRGYFRLCPGCRKAHETIHMLESVTLS